MYCKQVEKMFTSVMIMWIDLRGRKNCAILKGSFKIVKEGNFSHFKMGTKVYDLIFQKT